MPPTLPPKIGRLAPHGFLTSTFQTLVQGSALSPSSNGIVWDVTSKAGDVAEVTLDQDYDLDIIGAEPGHCCILIVRQDGTGGWSLTLPAGSIVRSSGSGAIALTPSPDAVDVLGFVFNGTEYLWTYNLEFN